MIREPGVWTAIATCIGVLITLVVTGVRITVILTRLVVSVQTLNESMKDVITHMDDHESRIVRLESRSP